MNVTRKRCENKLRCYKTVLQENFPNVLQEKDVRTSSGVTLQVLQEFFLNVIQEKDVRTSSGVTRKFSECVTRKRYENMLRCYKCYKKNFRMCYKKKM